ncbi:MAG TPA: sorbosone dehydrogenase family protein [Rhodocyclaceae bacterium]|nr:sorbosone dehydrogenase family protein [Rhodocyclaceae bacterium]HNB80327.1 sorbosone dehydrogenase family protein [Rhodocyclaceae bacterium]HNH14748.1 sorbosone dehydrogenase family protein [Rhodocyclaceae bacterium]
MNNTLIAALLALVLLCACSATPAQNPPIERLKLPPGFALEVWARVPEPRAMTLGADRTLFVGSRGAGKVHAIKFDETLRAGAVSTVAEGLDMPVGVAFRDSALYVSSIGRILRYDGIEAKLASPPRPAVVSDRFPGDKHHGWKFIAFGPDGKLYVPVGAPCNICDRDADGYANIMRMNPDGSQLEVYARGVRNSVGFDWHPQTKALWFTDNGRDWMGDDQPSCELNHAPKPGMHFGYPFCHAGTIPDPEFGSRRKCGEFTPPAANLGPHVAPLGMRFYAGTQFPADYRDRIFIALHGSWNRAKKSGYQVVTARLDGDRVVAVEPFITGWLQGESNWGRPADVLVLPDGSLLVSDDQANAIYRVRYAPG